MQPIPYSHKKHLAFGLAVQVLPHESGSRQADDVPGHQHVHVVPRSRLPRTSRPSRSSPSIAKSKQPIPWVRVYTVLPGVAWTHRAHLEAGVKCETCHGHVAQMDAMSEVTSVTTMYSCLNCHEMNHAKTACDTCHKH